MMTVTLAQIAGVPEIAVFTPSIARDAWLQASSPRCSCAESPRSTASRRLRRGRDGVRHQNHPGGRQDLWPSNAYVCEAMRQVFGASGWPPARPQRTHGDCDGTARADYAAADLLAQAEHGSGKEKIYLVSTSARVRAAIMAEIETQLSRLLRAEVIRKVLANGFLAVETETLEQAADVANVIAPEHLELLVAPRAAARLTRRITTAGAIMVGNETPTAWAISPRAQPRTATGRSGRFFSACGWRISGAGPASCSTISEPAPRRARGGRICRAGTARCARPLGRYQDRDGTACPQAV